MKKIIVLPLLIAMAACPGMAGAVSPASLDECQKLKDKIEQYVQLRRKGGSGSQMDSWKRSRRQLEKTFRERGCQRLQWQLE